jgi:hypothetical protein
MLHTNPTLTTFRWQKHAARKSTSIRVGRIRCALRVDGEGRKLVSRYVRRAWEAVI